MPCLRLPVPQHPGGDRYRQPRKTSFLVRSGTFHGNVNVSKPIVLRGEMWHGDDLPLINADGNGSCITVTADEAVVESMRVTNSGNLPGDAGIQVRLR